MDKQKGLKDLVKQDNNHSEENQKRMEEIEKLINENKNVEITKNSKLPFLVISLLIIVIVLLILVNILDNKVDNKIKNYIVINEIR